MKMKEWLSNLSVNFWLLLILLLMMINASFVQAAVISQDPRPKCDASLWSHVYSPDRLQILAKCKHVTGTVMAVRTERDGDYHILLKPDKRYVGLLTPANVKLQNGSFVLEPICIHEPIRQLNAKDSCGNFRQNLTIPFVGQHISVNGSYVLDHDHSDWAEIHPITSLKLIS